MSDVKIPKVPLRDMLTAYLGVLSRKSAQSLMPLLREVPLKVLEFLWIVGVVVAFFLLPLKVLEFLWIVGVVVAFFLLCIPVGYIIVGLYGYVHMKIAVLLFTSLDSLSLFNICGMLMGMGVSHVIIGAFIFVTFKEKLIPGARDLYHNLRVYALLKDGGYFLVHQSVRLVCTNSVKNISTRTLVHIAPQSPSEFSFRGYILATDTQNLKVGEFWLNTRTVLGLDSVERVEEIDLPLYVGLRHQSEEFRQLLAGCSLKKGSTEDD